MSKLRRHLGEDIPEQAVPIIQITALGKKEQKLGIDPAYLRTAITVGRILSLPDEEDSDLSSESSEGDDAYNSEWVLAERVVRIVGRRESRKWVLERGGQRWEESNYEKVIQTLRAL